jgi:putative nucleotidyltransferase with HDIG domain
VSTVGSAAHLASRFVRSLVPLDASDADDAWARTHLLAGEIVLWDRMSRQDRRHSVTVAREVHRRLPAAPRWATAAALLHDVGKVDSGLGTFARVGATIVGSTMGRDRGGVVGRYLQHDRIGAELLTAAGSDARTAAWAAEHHRPAAMWTLPHDIAVVLKAADDD